MTSIVVSGKRELPVWLEARMPTILNLIKQILPYGTNPVLVDGTNSEEPSWKELPRWPPDLFAIAATLLERAGCYAHQQFVGWTELSGLSQPQYGQSILEAARMMSKRLPKLARDDWKVILKHSQKPVIEPFTGTPPIWWKSAVRLMAIADEACVGVGFSPLPENFPDLGSMNPFAWYVAEAYRRAMNLEFDRRLPNPTRSLCLAVPRSEACVQPVSISSSRVSRQTRRSSLEIPFSRRSFQPQRIRSVGNSRSIIVGNSKSIRLSVTDCSKSWT